jgi:hypothetical protein
MTAQAEQDISSLRFLGLNYGYRTPLTTLVAQMSYGLVLGAYLPG